MMQRSHKIKLKPTAKQSEALSKAVGCARYAYNWGLTEWKAQYALSLQGLAEKPNVYSIHRAWTKHKPLWAYDSPKDATGRAIINLGKAWTNFWTGRCKAPVFKQKGHHDTFYAANDRLSVTHKRVKLSVIGSVRMVEDLRFAGKIVAAIVSKEAGDWFISIRVELPDIQPSSNPSVVGVDVGAKSIAVASDGTILENPRLVRKYAEKLATASRVLARKERRSHRREKALLKLQSIHQKIVNVRTDAIHKFTAKLSKNHGVAVIETLDIKSMKESEKRWLRCLLADTAMSEVHRQLGYKMRVVKAPAFYPSSKTCSSCGAVVDIWDTDISDYKCNICNYECDRDLNAALNLRNMRWVTA